MTLRQRNIDIKTIKFINMTNFIFSFFNYCKDMASVKIDIGFCSTNTRDCIAPFILIRSYHLNCNDL